MRHRLFGVLFWLVALVGVLCLYSRDSFSQIPDAATRYQRLYTRIIESEFGIAAPTASLAAQIHQESGWDCTAVSRTGARGCAQFMPATARWIGEVDEDLAITDAADPAWSFQAQAAYMKWLHDRVKGSDPCEKFAYALSAYNGGLGRVYKRQALSHSPGVCIHNTCEINPGISPANQAENADYPKRILIRITPRYVSAGWGASACN